LRSILNAYNNPEKPVVFIIAGPTASGKTAMGIKLAQETDGEIVSADSMQIYKGLNITTAKPTTSELAAVPHHVISVVNPSTPFSVADYVPLAKKALADITSRGKQPIIVGGTGLYIKALRDGIDFSSLSSDNDVRERLLRETEELNARYKKKTEYSDEETLLSEQKLNIGQNNCDRSKDLTDTSNTVPYGNMVMWRRLLDIDPKSASLIPPQNITRVIRALEISETTGIPFSDYKRSAVKGNDDFSFRGIYLDFADRSVLYDRINKRVDAMLAKGMVDECEKAYRSGALMGSTISQAIGYKELIPYFDGESTLEAAIFNIKQSTRRYAKRQLTWFRHDEALSRVEISDYDTENGGCEKNFKIIYEFFSKQ
jgi:tRNA dimethylallyltransferase